MKFVIQRVRKANVKVNNEIVGKIDNGFLVLIGITHNDNKENAKKIQEVREQQIHNLKNQIKGINENQSKENQLENTIEKYINTSGYITKNGEDLSDEQLRNMQRKQENRKVQIKNLEEE